MAVSLATLNLYQRQLHRLLKLQQQQVQKPQPRAPSLDHDLSQCSHKRRKYPTRLLRDIVLKPFATRKHRICAFATFHVSNFDISMLSYCVVIVLLF